MTQADYIIANAAGAVVRADLNDQFEAIATQNSGPTAPSVTFANMWWFDDALDFLYQRNEANTAWILTAKKDGAGWTPYRQGTLLGTAAEKDHGTVGDTIPKNDTANVFSQPQQIVSVLSGPTEDPAWDEYRNNSSPGDNDILAVRRLQGENDAGEKITYVKTGAQIADVSDSSEAGIFFVNAYYAGILARRWNFGGGQWDAAAVGGDPGPGFINLSGGIQIDGAAQTLSKFFEGVDTSISNGALSTFTHSLGARPRLVVAALVNTSGNRGFAVGDEVRLESQIWRQQVSGGPTDFWGATVWWNATTVKVKIGDDGIRVVEAPDGTNGATLTLGSWDLNVRAWV